MPAVLAVLLSAAGPALLFAPVFGIVPLVLPLALIVAVGFGVVEAGRHWPALVPWRAVLMLVAGLLALTETLLFATTASGLPTGGTVRALAAGLTDSWQLTLQSTWPARSDPELMLFVPLAALAATVLAVELLSRLRWPLVALLPGLAVLGLSQAYVALTGLTAMLAAFGFAVLAAVLLSSTTAIPAAASAGPRAPRRPVIAVLLVLPTLVLTVAGALLGTAADPVERPAYSLRDKQFAPLPPERVTSPLDELSEHLQHPREEVFTYSTDFEVDRWRVAVLDRFDGVNWEPGVQPRRLGNRLQAAPAVTVEVTEHRARVEFAGTEGPWLPSQAMPASVTGLAPLVDETSGMLLLPGRDEPVGYELSWWEPIAPPEGIGGAAIDSSVRVGDVGEVPEEVTELARRAVGETRPAFQTALVLERFMRNNYTLASGDDLPSGTGWPQLERFLAEERGTTAQFAAAYVAMARIIGLPARVVVGYRASGAGEDVVVRRGDALAWPEVAVEGVGWVPLDPAPAPSGDRTAERKGLAGATDEARENLPPQEELRDPELREEEPADDGSRAGGGFSLPVTAILVTAGGLAVLWLLGVPLARFVRGWTRRRRPGARSVVGAWAEARDRLRAHGVPFTAGMTVRDLAGAARPVVDQSVVAGLHDLARSVDVALWSRFGPNPATVDEAWSAVRALRRGLARRPLTARLRAALDVRTLFGSSDFRSRSPGLFRR